MSAKFPLILMLVVSVTTLPLPADMPKNATEVGDYNSDGIDDYLLLDPERATSKNSPYFVYLSNKATGHYKKLEIDVSHPEWDAKSKTLTSHSFGGGGRTYFHKTYKFFRNSPKLIMTIQRTEKHIEGD